MLDLEPALADRSVCMCACLLLASYTKDGHTSRDLQLLCQGNSDMSALNMHMRGEAAAVAGCRACRQGRLEVMWCVVSLSGVLWHLVHTVMMIQWI